MQNDLINEGILNISKDFKNFYFCKSKDVYNFFEKKLRGDIFYMLNKKSKEKFLKLTKGGKKSLY